MRLSVSMIGTLFLLLFSVVCSATPGRDGEIRGKSETGKVQLIIAVSDLDSKITNVQLVVNNDTIDYLQDCDTYPVIDPANHLITLCLQQKGTSPGAANAKSLKIWATPNSFVKMVEGPNSWRFKAKLTGNAVKDVTNIDCVYMRQP